MANYYGVGRTNYFRVKDEAAFLSDLEEIEGVRIHDEIRKDGQRWFMLMDDNDDGWCLSWKDERKDAAEIWLPEVIARHLIDDEVAIIMESGHEKHRYVSGWAVAINNKGDFKQLTLNDIYDLAKELGPNITDASY